MSEPSPDAVDAALALIDAMLPYDPEKAGSACDVLKPLRLNDESYIEAAARFLAAEVRRLEERLNEEIGHQAPR